MHRVFDLCRKLTDCRPGHGTGQLCDLRAQFRHSSIERLYFGSLVVCLRSDREAHPEKRLLLLLGRQRHSLDPEDK